MNEIIGDLEATSSGWRCRRALPSSAFVRWRDLRRVRHPLPEARRAAALLATASEYPLPRAVAWAFRVPPALYRALWKYRPMWNAEIHVMRRMMLNNMQRWRGGPLLRSLSVPTMVITGERDTYFPRRVYEDLGKMIPNAEIVDVGSAKHKVQLERHQAVNRALDRFIRDNRGALLARSWDDDRA